MGVVYRARDLTEDRDVALKLLLPERAGDAGAKSRMLREARAVAAVDHPSIVSVLDVGENDEGVYIVTELVPGETLRSRLASGRIPSESARSIATEIASALAAAHARGIVHRDVKPENVMVTPDGRAKLLDFGLAKLSNAPVVEEDKGAGTVSLSTAEGRILGTPGYMSPEQAVGQTADERSDVFSFGALAYEILTGRPAFDAPSQAERMIATVRDEVPRADSIDPSIPSPWPYTVARCLSKKPEARYENAGALVEALRRGALSSRADARAAGPGPRRVLRAGAVVAAASAAVAAALALGLRTEASRKTEDAKGEPTTVATASASAAVPPGWSAPRPCKGEAGAALESGVQDLRQGNWAGAHASFKQALEADPTCGSAALRLVITGYFYDGPDVVRGSYRRALQLRASLNERDAGYLAIYEPLLARDPPDEAEYLKRILALADSYPKDPEILGAAAFALLRGPRDWDNGRKLAERSVAVDPGFADGWQALARAEFWANDENLVSAAHALDRCMEASPIGTDCIEERAMMHLATGECTELERLARLMVTRDPKSDTPHWFLALSLASLDEPKGAVEEALRQRAARLEEPERSRRERFDRVRVDAAYGDFDAVEAGLAELEGSLGGESFALHAELSLLAGPFFEETGRVGRAAEVADALLAARRAIPTDTYSYRLRYGVHHAEPHALATLERAGALSHADVEKRLDAWQKWTLGLKNYDVRTTWALTDALFAESAEEAREATRTLPRMPVVNMNSSMNLAVGRALLLADRGSDALTYLDAGARACRALEEPFARTHALLLAGTAREAAGDREGACAAYRRIKARWGAARASRTAAEAAKRARGLACR